MVWARHPLGENLNKFAQQDEVDAARDALRGIIGEVTVVEEGTHVLAYPKLSKNVGYKSGAENAMTYLYIEPSVYE
jgi:hypothetical protein